MPLSSPGSLSVQDALDVSAYFTTQPRPDLASKSKDWPNGGRPKDARY
jgi:thiosulfate dehydrogenase